VLAASRTASPQWFNHLGDTLPDLALTIAKAIAILLLTYFVAGIVLRRFRSGFERGGMPIAVAILLSRVFWGTAWALGLFWAFYAVGRDLTPLAALIGVTGLALSLSLQALLQNLVAGIYLLVERPFVIGDTIVVVGPNGANHEGTVEDIQLRTTHLRSRDDELILMPNSSIFGGVVTNRTAVGGYVSHMTVTFPRDMDPEHVRQKLFPVLLNLPSTLQQPTPLLRVESMEESSWTGSLSYWVASAAGTSDAVWVIGSEFPACTLNVAAPA
jgi:small conductance mechanosensitive channel